MTGTPLALLTSLPAVASIGRVTRAAARAAARGEGAAAAAGQPLVCVEEHVFAHWLHACSRRRRQLQHRVCTLKSTRAAQNRACKGHNLHRPSPRHPAACGPPEDSHSRSRGTLDARKQLWAQPKTAKIGAALTRHAACQGAVAGAALQFTVHRKTPKPFGPALTRHARCQEAVAGAAPPHQQVLDL